MEIIFAGDLRQALYRCADGSLLLRDTKHLSNRSSQSRHGLVLFPPACQFLQLIKFFIF